MLSAALRILVVLHIPVLGGVLLYYIPVPIQLALQNRLVAVPVRDDENDSQDSLAAQGLSGVSGGRRSAG